MSFVDGAATAGAKAISESGVDPASIGLMVNTSVSRKHLEPSTAVAVHHALGLPPSCQNFDVTNACLGFVNGMELAAAMIDSGMIDYALVVNGEDARPVQERTIDLLNRPDTVAKDVMGHFATLTLGSGAVAMVLGRADRHPEGHRLVGSVSRAGTEHHQLCTGDNDGMQTDLKGLLAAGLALSEDLWADAAAEFDWAQGMDRYVIHQVSKVHTQALVDRFGIDPARVPPPSPPGATSGRRRCPSRWPARRTRSPRATGCCSWASARASTPAASRSPGDGGNPSPRCRGLDPAWSRHIAVTHANGEKRLLARARQRGRRSGRHAAVRARQPHLVLPVAPPATGRPAGLAGRRSRPAGDGWSERPPAPRTLAQRVADLGDLTDALGVTGPVVTVAHDWGGIISLGWAVEHREQVRGIVLTNTAVAMPEGDLGPALIRLAHAPVLRTAVTVASDVFVRGATALSWPPLPQDVRRAYRSRTGRPRGDGRWASSSLTSLSARATPHARRKRPSLSASAPWTSQRCSSGVPATRCSGRSTWPTSAGACRGRRCTATKAPRTCCPRTRRSTPKRWPRG